MEAVFNIKEKSMRNINSAVSLLKQTEEDNTLANQKEFVDMARQRKKDLYDNTSLEIAIKSLNFSRWNLFFVILTLLISILSLVIR